MISRLTGVPAGSLHRELRQLADAGLLVAIRSGNQVLYSANEASPVFRELAAMLDKTAGTPPTLHEHAAEYTVAPPAGSLAIPAKEPTAISGCAMAGDGRDAALLLDMLRYAEEALRMVEGLTYKRYIKDRVRVLAVERAIEVLGEAARHVSQSRKNATPAIPWKQVSGQRNMLARMHGDIDQFRLFRTASEDIPRLIVALRKVSG